MSDGMSEEWYETVWKQEQYEHVQKQDAMKLQLNEIAQQLGEVAYKLQEVIKSYE